MGRYYESTVYQNVYNTEKICMARSSVFSGLNRQAKRMKIISDKSHPQAEVGANVNVPFPDVYKGIISLRNTIAVILNTNKMTYINLGLRRRF